MTFLNKKDPKPNLFMKFSKFAALTMVNLKARSQLGVKAVSLRDFGSSILKIKAIKRNHVTKLFVKTHSSHTSRNLRFGFHKTVTRTGFMESNKGGSSHFSGIPGYNPGLVLGV